MVDLDFSSIRPKCRAMVMVDYLLVLSAWLLLCLLIYFMVNVGHAFIHHHPKKEADPGF